MDLNDLDEIFDFEPEEEDEGPDLPDYRATIRENRLTVVGWAPHLLSSGPNAKILAERAEAGVTVADLRVPGSGERELLVEYLAVADRRRADRLLARWAESVGHTRVWFPDRLIVLDSHRPLGAAEVECPTCGAGWQDSTPDFWAQVRRCGFFPSLCPICNGDLPQWRWRPSRRARAHR